MGEFDIAVSSLAFHYVRDFPNLVRSISKLLKEGGALIFSQEHPIFTASKQNKDWIRDENGQKLHWPFDDYSDEGERTGDWLVEGVVNYHRTVGTILNTLIENNFVIEKVLEPVPGEREIEANLTLADVIRRPAFLIVKARKG